MQEGKLQARRLILNVSMLSIVQIANVLIPLATLPYLARVMGAEAFGQFALCFAMLQYVVLIAEYGFNLSATKAVVLMRSDKPELSKIFWTVILCKLALLLVAWGVVWLWVANTEKFSALRSLICWGLPYVLGVILFPQWLLQGLDRMREMAWASVLGKVALLPMLFWGVDGSADLSLAVGLTGVSSVITAMVALWLIARSAALSWHLPNRSSIRSAFSDGAYIFASSVATNIYSASVVVFLGYVSGAAEVASYTVADKLRQAVQIMLTPVQQALYPRMSELMRQDVHQAFRLTRKILPILFLYCLAGGLLLAFGAEPLIEWIFGKDYASAVPVLRVFAFLPLVVAVSGLFGVQILTGSGRQRVVFRALLVGSSVCAIVIYPLSNRWGAVGASIAVFLTELVITLLLWRSVVREFPKFSKIMRGVL